MYDSHIQHVILIDPPTLNLFSKSAWIQHWKTDLLYSMQVRSLCWVGINGLLDTRRKTNRYFLSCCTISGECWYILRVRDGFVFNRFFIPPQLFLWPIILLLQSKQLTAAAGINRLSMISGFSQLPEMWAKIEDSNITARQKHLLCHPRHLKSAVDELAGVLDSLQQIKVGAARGERCYAYVVYCSLASCMFFTLLVVIFYFCHLLYRLWAQWNHFQHL